MLKRFLSLFHQCHKCSCEETTKIIRETISPEDEKRIASLFIDERFKLFTKLKQSLILDVVNKMLQKGEKFEEFLGVKWAIALQNMLENQVKTYFLSSIKTQTKSGITPESMENMPDTQPTPTL